MRDESSPPPGPGRALREVRLARGVALADMARATRIGQSYLDALEADRVGDLPAPVFVRGFIRAYCEHLGEPPDEHLRRYRQLVGERPDAEPPVVALPRRPPMLGPIGVSLILIALLGAGILALNQLARPQRAQVAATPPQPGAPGPEPAAAGAGREPSAGQASGGAPAVAVPQPAGPRPAAEPATGPAGPGGGATTQGRDPVVTSTVASAPLKLTVRAVEQTWLRVQTEDGRVVSELLQAGAIREWTSDRRFVLTIGNAAGIELTLNGQPMPPLGGRGVVRRLEIPGPGPGTAEASQGR